MAGSAGKHVSWVVVFCAMVQLAPAQGTQKSKLQHSEVKSSGHSPASRLLTADEGLAIIGAALDARYHLQAGGDCSHLVHTIYEQAGFSYPYTDSNDLYAGIENFQRVVKPRPGDLAVWRGHAAIVVNPAQRSFFSATTKGLRVEYYDSAYWKNRGPVRFFRYVKPAGSLVTSRRNTPVKASTPPRVQASSSEPVVPEESADPPKAALPAKELTTAGLPQTLEVHSSRPQPRQLNEALARSLEETEKALRGAQAVRLPDPLLVFDQVDVKTVHVKGNQGWAEVKVDGLYSLNGGRLAPRKRSEQQKWVLTRRDADTWELLLPHKTDYLQHDLAVRVLAHQLASLSDHPSDAGDSSKQQTELLRTLNLLLEK